MHLDDHRRRRHCLGGDALDRPIPRGAPRAPCSSSQRPSCSARATRRVVQQAGAAQARERQSGPAGQAVV